MRESLSRTQIDSDKASVSALTKALQDKDGQIEILKKQLEDYAREMDKSAAVINNLNKTFYESIHFFCFIVRPKVKMTLMTVIV